MAFPILTTEDLGALSVVRREQLFQYKVDTFSRLPDEILLLILSQVITGCISLYQGGSRHLLRSAAYVRRVCRRFRALADQLMFNTPLQQILLIGPIFGDFRQMTSIYEEYRNILWTRLSRGSPGHISLRTTVHFLPCLDTSDSVNWFRDNSLAEELNDELAPQRAITGHYAAALVLSRILQEVIDRQYGKDGKKSLFLVFHEIDMTYFRGDQYFQERHCHPEFMPFWDSKGMQLILREWGWIFQPPCKKNYHHIQIILPNVAWATNCPLHGSGRILECPIFHCAAEFRSTVCSIKSMFESFLIFSVPPETTMLLFCLYREAAASTAPIPLNAALLVTTISTGYFHSMNCFHPVVFQLASPSAEESLDSAGILSAHTDANSHTPIGKFPPKVLPDVGDDDHGQQ
ncbi:hypothetical protein CLAIMM_12342 isoform 2 [Cladophialophora immunda]|nr:hypothetical protein CLAIMM_12342 isoform 2 [Cladophialophora immunda]